MQLFIAELVFILLLIGILLILIKEESKIKKSRIPRAKLKEYWGGQERRQAMRITTTFTVTYMFSKKQNLKCTGKTDNLSTGGIRLIVYEKLNKGTILSLEFEIPEISSTVRASGKVVWTSGEFSDRDENGKRIFQAGIQFLQISEKNKNTLIQYIDRVKT